MSGEDKAGPLEFRQRFANDIETIETHLDGRQQQIHTTLPGHIVSYNAATMTASVQIALQSIHQKVDGTLETLTIKPITDVPVCFPGGGGHILTFPVAAGDDCMILFNERNIDNWYARGGTMQPADYRMHDINDAVCLVGVRSQPKALGSSGGSMTRAAGPAASATAVQIRSDDGKTVITVDGPNNKISLSCKTEVVIDCAKLTVTGELHCYSEVIAQANTAGYVTLSKHERHTTPGSNAPQPGT